MKQLHLLTEDTTPDTDAYVVFDKSTYGEAVKVTYTKLLQALPVAPQTSGGIARGTAAVDLQVLRTMDVQSAYGSFSVILGGLYNTASYTLSSAWGCGAIAYKWCQIAYAAGYFDAPGDAQRSVYVLRIATTDATPTVLFLNGANAYLTIADDTVWNFRAEVSGISADADEYAAYTVVGLVKRANGTVAVAGVVTTTHAESDAGLDATAEADDVNKALNIKITGKAVTPMRWVAAVYTTEVTFAG